MYKAYGIKQISKNCEMETSLNLNKMKNQFNEKRRNMWKNYGED